MPQEYAAHRGINNSIPSQSTGNNDGELALNTNTTKLKFWYCKKVGHRRVDCRKRKADKKKRGGEGNNRIRFNGHETAYVAITKAMNSFPALIDLVRHVMW